MEKMELDLKEYESKKNIMNKTYESLHSQASSLLVFTHQWKEVEEHLDSMRDETQTRLKEIQEREKLLEAKESEANELCELEQMIEEKRKEVTDIKNYLNSLQSLMKELGEKERQMQRAIKVQDVKFDLKEKLIRAKEETLNEIVKAIEGQKQEEQKLREMIKEHTEVEKVLGDKERQIQRAITEQSIRFDLIEKEIKAKDEKLNQIVKDIEEQKQQEQKLKEERLKEEEKLKEQKKTVVEVSKPLQSNEELRKKIELKVKDHCLRKKSLEEWSCNLERREKELELREKQLSSKADELDLLNKRTLSEFQSMAKQLEKDAKQLQAKERQFEVRSSTMEKLQQECEKRLEETEKQLEVKSVTMEQMHEEREKKLEAKERQLEEKSETMEKLQQEYKKNLEEKERQLEVKRATMEQMLQQREKCLEETERQLEVRSVTMEQMHQECEKHLETKERQLEMKSETMEKLQQECKKNLEEKERQLEEKSVTMEKMHQQREKDLEAKERQLEEQGKELELTKKQFGSQMKMKSEPLESTSASELQGLVEKVDQHKQATELSRASGTTDKAPANNTSVASIPTEKAVLPAGAKFSSQNHQPTAKNNIIAAPGTIGKRQASIALPNNTVGAIQRLIEQKRLVRAYNRICKFNLFNKFPPQQVFKEHVEKAMKCMEISKTKENLNEQVQVVNQGIDDLRCVTDCIKAHNLKSQYTSESIEKQIQELKKFIEDRRNENQKKRLCSTVDSTFQQHEHKFQRTSVSAVRPPRLHPDYPGSFYNGQFSIPFNNYPVPFSMPANRPLGYGNPGFVLQNPQ